MLTKAHAISDFKNGRLVPDRLTRSRNEAYVGYAAQMLELYRNGVGKTRGDLHRRLERIFDNEEDCLPRRIKSFIKLLDDAGKFSVVGDAEVPWKLRLTVFSLAGKMHPLVQQKEELHENLADQVKVDIAAELQRPWPEIEANLFADVTDCHVLTGFTGYATADELLSDYNVSQARVALFGATEMRITATQDYRRLLTAAKLADLVYKIEQVGEDKYRFTFTGAASDLRVTHRYGVQMAGVLPTLLRMKGWSMEADILLKNNRRIRYLLDEQSRLGTHLPAFDVFDSTVEEAFFAKWDGKVRLGWSLSRESRILHENQHAFFPDFLLKHEDGTEILFEIVGHWTPEYLRHKLETLRRFAHQRFLLAVKQGNTEFFTSLGIPIIPYKGRVILDDVLTALTSLRAGL